LRVSASSQVSCHSPAAQSAATIEPINIWSVVIIMAAL